MTARTSFDAESFHTGFNARLQELMSGNKGMEKSAISPSIIPTVAVDPARRHALTSLGHDLFKSLTDPNVHPFKQALKIMLTGYNQLPHLARIATRHPVTGDVSNLHLPQVQQALAELGATAEPRLKLLKALPPAAIGAGALGAAGYMYGQSRGQHHADFDTANNLMDLPIMQRLRYLMAPKDTVSHWWQNPQNS